MSLLRSVFAALILASPCAVLAQEAPEAESPLSWEVSAVSDYLFRGVSQTNEKPTLQANATWTFASGVYVSGALSGVDFGEDSPDLEVDYTLGYGHALTDAVALDLSVNRYSYPGYSEMAYNEWVAVATIQDTYALTVGYSNDVWNSGTTGMYYGVGAEWPLPRDFALSASVGRNVFREPEIVEAVNYTDWSIAVSKALGPVNVSLGYFGTDSRARDSFGKLADNRVLLNITLAH